MKVNSDGRVGYLYFRDGSLVDAESPGLKGDKAAVEMISWEDAVVHIQDGCHRQRSVQSSLMNLLLEGSRVREESIQARSVEKKNYDTAVGHIVAFRLEKGQEILIRILRNNPRCHMGWFWYSRTLSSVKDIATALSQARRLAPEHPEVGRDLDCLERARASLAEDTVKRCPFCWAPLHPKANACFHCNLHLTISKELLEHSPDRADADVVDQAVKRFSDVLEREDNLYASYYMAVAHYNMNDLDRALELLNDTVALSGGRAFFKNQLNLFLNFLASGQAVETGTAAVAGPMAGKNKTVLVVEDSATTRKVISATLDMNGYRVIEAADGLQALSRLYDTKPDVILLDIILPKMNGYEILSAIKNKREFKSIPVIMLTGRDGFLNKMKGKIAGASAYITKPFQPESLLLAIERHL